MRRVWSASQVWDGNSVRGYPAIVAGRIHNVAIDCRTPSQLVRFWAAALGYDVQHDEDRYGALTDPTGTGPRLLFQVVPEGKVVKNRVHLDVAVPDRDAEIERLVELGGIRLRDVEEDGEAWTVLQDPEGNEFCVFET
jgi:catechol 2,3-dioxygenase-like lactoylglutathione lyase family enzyme